MSTDYCVYLMMKKYGLIILWTASLLLAATGCVQPVDIAPPDEREVFIKCILMNDTVQQVTLLYSGDIEQETFDPVEDAEVYVVGPEKVRIMFHPIGEGRWENGFNPSPGCEYMLHVKIPGRDEITAVTRFPDKFTVYPHLIAPARWVEDSRNLVQGYAPVRRPKAFRLLLPPWFGTLRCYIPDWKTVDNNGGVSSPGPLPDYYVLDRITEVGGTTLHQEMPGICFHVDVDHSMNLYILGTYMDCDGNVTRIQRLGTNHKALDRNNLLPETFALDPVSSPSDTVLIINPNDIDGRGDYMTISPHNQSVYKLAMRAAYVGQPLYADYLRIKVTPDYDNGLNLYSIINEEYIKEDRGAVVNPPFVFPSESVEVGYCLCWVPGARRFFSVYGDFDWEFCRRNTDGAHPSLYFCSVSEEYDAYLQNLRQLKHNGDMLSELYSNSLSSYTNIDHAFGVFGALYVLRHDCDVDGISGSDYQDSYGFRSSYVAYPAPLPEL